MRLDFRRSLLSRRTGACVVAVLGAFLAASAAVALPIVAVDLDPSTPGIQDSLSVQPFDSFVADIVVVGVEEGSPLNGFEFDLDFEPAGGSPQSVVNGGFLLDPVMIVQQVLGSIRVEFAEVSIGPAGAFGDGILAKITFNTFGPGEALLDLNNVILSAPFGVSIPIANVADASISVVPEPGTLPLLALGLLLLARRRHLPGMLVP
jgi:hypothetical protein